jgi:hypothetical protein
MDNSFKVRERDGARAIDNWRALSIPSSASLLSALTRQIIGPIVGRFGRNAPNSTCHDLGVRTGLLLRKKVRHQSAACNPMGLGR